VIAIILNPASGLVRHGGLGEEIEALCRQAGLDSRVHETRDGSDIAAAAREALTSRPDAVVAAGGDGTVSAVASVVAGTSTPLGVLPLGTLNHFAKDLGIPTDRAKAIDVIAARRTRRLDVGRVNERIFVNNSSIGVYPSIVETRERLRRQGRSKWTALAMATFEVLRRDDEMSIRLEADRTKIMAHTPFVFVGNNEYLAEGIRLGARTRLDEGELHVYFAPPVRTRHLPRLFAHAVFGLTRREQMLMSLATRELWIDTPFALSLKVACDGELHSLDTPLHYRTWPGALTVLAGDEDTTARRGHHATT
jgi:diacylglycerol kinase family enzyme